MRKRHKLNEWKEKKNVSTSVRNRARSPTRAWTPRKYFQARLIFSGRDSGNWKKYSEIVEHLGLIWSSRFWTFSGTRQYYCAFFTIFLTKKSPFSDFFAIFLHVLLQRVKPWRIPNWKSEMFALSPTLAHFSSRSGFGRVWQFIFISDRSFGPIASTAIGNDIFKITRIPFCSH